MDINRLKTKRLFNHVSFTSSKLIIRPDAAALVSPIAACILAMPSLNRSLKSSIYIKWYHIFIFYIVSINYIKLLYMSLSQSYLCFKNPFFGFLLSCVQIDHCRIFPFDFSNLKLELISKITYFLDPCPYGVLFNLKIILRKCKKLGIQS